MHAALGIEICGRKLSTTTLFSKCNVLLNLALTCKCTVFDIYVSWKQIMTQLELSSSLPPAFIMIFVWIIKKCYNTNALMQTNCFRWVLCGWWRCLGSTSCTSPVTTSPVTWPSSRPSSCSASIYVLTSPRWDWPYTSYYFNYSEHDLI